MGLGELIPAISPQVYITELRDSIPSESCMAKGGGENATKAPQEGTPKTIVDKVS